MLSELLIEVGELKRKIKQLEILAFEDELTGLKNKNWLMKNWDAVKNYKYIYFIDINNMRGHNRLGHINGDNVIRRVAQSLGNCNGFIVIRFGGDEFLAFSDTKNALCSTKEYSCGCYEKDMNDLSECVNRASLNMFETKHKWRARTAYA